MDSTERSTVRKLAAVGIVGGLATAASGAVVAAIVQPNSEVSEEMWSYPLTSDALAPVSVLYAVFHVCVFLGVLAFARSGHAGPSRSARIGELLALAGTFLFFIAEFASIPFADQRMDDTGPMVVGATFGLGVTLTAIGLITAGVATLRAARWQGWRRYAPLAAGVWALAMIGISFTGALAAGVAIYGLALTLLSFAVYTSPSTVAAGSRPGKVRVHVE